MKTTKSKKTQYSGEITMIEFLKANPDLTTREIAVALGRGMSSVGNQLRQLHGTGQIIRGRIGFDLPVWFKPANDKQRPTSAFFAGAIAVFDKTWRGEKFSYINRTELEAKGHAFMALAQFAIDKKVTA